MNSLISVTGTINMKENISNSPKSTEDIDLLRLAERAILFFRRFKWLFIGAVLLGLISGFVFYKKIATTYSSKMLVHSFMLSNQEELQIVNTWNELLGKKEYEILANGWHCDRGMLGKVKKIKGKELQQVFSVANPNGFTIDVVVTDNSILPDLQKAIVYGFENGEYTRERLRIKKAALADLIDKTKSEITKLESTKQQIQDIIAGKEHASSSLIVDGFSVNKQLIEMNEKLQGFNEQLSFTTAVQVLSGFQRFGQPSGPHLIPWLIIGVFAFVCLAYVYAMYRCLADALKNRSQNTQS